MLRIQEKNGLIGHDCAGYLQDDGPLFGRPLIADRLEKRRRWELLPIDWKPSRIDCLDEAAVEIRWNHAVEQQEMARLEMYKNLERRKRSCLSRVYDRCARTVPPPAGQPRTFSIEGGRTTG
jgi:hypothetical protein